MKLKQKLIALALIPLFVLGAVVLFVYQGAFRASISRQVTNTLKSTVAAGINAYNFGIEGEYHQDKEGDLWKGDAVNLSQDTSIITSIAENSNLEASLIYDGKRIATSITDQSGKSAVGTSIDTKIWEKLKSGSDVMQENVSIGGKMYSTYYMPLYQEGSDTEVIGAFFVGHSMDVLNQSVKMLMLITSAMVFVFIVIVCIVSIINASSIERAVKQGVDAVKEVAKGNLTIKLDKKQLVRKDEIGDMSRSISKLSEELRQMIGEVVSHSDKLIDTSEGLNETAQGTAITLEQVEKAVQHIAHGAMAQAEETQKASKDVMEIGHMIRETTAEAENLNHIAVRIQDSSRETFQILKQLEEINEKAKQSIGVIYKQTNSTNESAIKIKEATNLITSIAEETNLLSLNASIEAARAGEQGRGFAVVAAQIQKLAEQSNESAIQIENIINLLIEESNKAVGSMQEVRGIMDTQVENVERTQEIFKIVKEGIDASLIGIDNITSRTESLNISKDSVINAVQNLTAIAQENAASAQETSASTTEVAAAVTEVSNTSSSLEGIAVDLERKVNVFQI